MELVGLVNVKEPLRSQAINHVLNSDAKGKKFKEITIEKSRSCWFEMQTINVGSESRPKRIRVIVVHICAVAKSNYEMQYHISCFVGSGRLSHFSEDLVEKADAGVPAWV